MVPGIDRFGCQCSAIVPSQEVSISVIDVSNDGMDSPILYAT